MIRTKSGEELIVEIYKIGDLRFRSAKRSMSKFCRYHITSEFRDKIKEYFKLHRIQVRGIWVEVLEAEVIVTDRLQSCLIQLSRKVGVNQMYEPMNVLKR